MGCIGICVPLTGNGTVWFDKFDEGDTGNKILVVCWMMILGGRVVVPEFDVMLVVVVLLIITPGEIVFNDKFDDTVVLIVDDRVLKVVVDKLLLFNTSVTVELINGDSIVLKTLGAVVFDEELLFTLLVVLEIEVLLTVWTSTVVFWLGKVVGVVLIVVEEFNEAVLFNNKVEFSWVNWVLLFTLTEVEFNILVVVVFVTEFIVLVIFVTDIIVVVVVLTDGFTLE